MEKRVGAETSACLSSLSMEISPESRKLSFHVPMELHEYVDELRWTVKFVEESKKKKTILLKVSKTFVNLIKIW